MICRVCQTNYHLQSNSWSFEGYSDNGEGIYIVQSNVFTPEILRGILEHAIQNGCVEISVDACLAEYVLCEGCQRLNIRLNKDRDELLNLPKYQNVIYYESF